jgi:hypothetical protein
MSWDELRGDEKALRGQMQGKGCSWDYANEILERRVETIAESRRPAAHLDSAEGALRYRTGQTGQTGQDALGAWARTSARRAIVDITSRAGL